MKIIPEPEWEILLKNLTRHRGIAVLIGAADSGKSTLARYLIKRFVSEHIESSLVDADVGQSSLGLPGAISMKIFRDEKDLEDFTFERMFYVGTVNPSKKIPFIIDGTKRMADLCKEESDITLIDTTGLISGEIGKALKINKIKAIRPEHVIALQREQELEHILGLIKDIYVHRIRVSRMAKVRKREDRVRYRKKKFGDYFKKEELNEFLFHTKPARFFYNGKPFKLRESEFTRGTVIGLNHDEDTIALGVVIGINDDSVVFQSPIKSLKNINKVVFGDINIW